MTTIVLSTPCVTWTNITQPTQQDIDQLAEQHPDFHPLNLHDCLTDLEFPKLDHHDDYVFLVMHMPVFDRVERICRPVELDLFVTHGTLVTVHPGELKPVADLFDAAASAAASADNAHPCSDVLSKGASHLMHRVLDACVTYCDAIVARVGKNVRQIERSMFRADPDASLHEVAWVRRDIISLRSILKPQLAVIQALIAGNWSFIHEELDPYWGDIGDHLAQQCALLDECSEVIAGLSDTIDTLASHRIDAVVRVLTVVTVLTMPLTLLAAMFGMNVALPFSQHPLVFFGLVAFGVIMSVAVTVYLRKRRWL